MIVERGEIGEAILQKIAQMMERIHVGPWTMTPEPFMGPVISVAAAERVLAAQQERLDKGGRALVEMKQLGPGTLSPGLIDVTDMRERPDVEIFGPLLQVIRVDDFDGAIAEANHTRYGLSAALFSDDKALWERFERNIRAGAINWNRQTTNASSRLPFGGIGDSGNHRPSGAFAADYCSYPVASLEVERLVIPATATPGIQF